MLIASLQLALAPQRPAEVWGLPGGRSIELRRVAPADADALQTFFSGLSLDSRHKRFHVGLRALSPQMLEQLTVLDPHRHLAWVAEAADGSRALVGDARYVHSAQQPGQAEFAVAVADGWQGLGLGRRLISHLAAHARGAGLEQLYGDVLSENRRMLALMRDLGAELQPHPDGAMLVRTVIDLQA